MRRGHLRYLSALVSLLTSSGRLTREFLEPCGTEHNHSRHPLVRVSRYRRQDEVFCRFSSRRALRALLAEDDEALRSVLARALREAGYVVDAVGDGEQATLYLTSYDYEVAIIDWRMPKQSGTEVVEQARLRGVRAPMLMLTARDATADRIEGLNRGADDYLVKPFDFGELMARLHALQRRPALQVDPVLRCGNLVYDPSTRDVQVDGSSIRLTATELGLLEILLRRAPAVVTRRMMALHVWDNEADAVGSNTIEVHLARLRTKLLDSRARIETVRRAGYRIVCE
jgi:two-component system copper resistance phosphate regulon response regulator CusR